MSLPFVFVIGDSISMQYGPYLEAALAGRFRYDRKRGENGDLDNPSGANGGDSGRVLAYLRGLAEAGDFHADWLLINCGLHDLKTDPQTGAKQVPLEEYESNLRAIVECAGALAGQMLWVRTTPVDDETHNSRAKQFHRHAVDLDAYNAAADRVMAEAGIPGIDLCGYTNSLGGPEVIFRDHVHFPEEVQRLQAAYIAGYLDAVAAASA